jgi:hypothetical protein
MTVPFIRKSTQRNSSWPGDSALHPKGRIHLRRSVDPLFALPLQSHGGPYIRGKFSPQLESTGQESLIHQVGSAMPMASCRLTGFSDRWRRLSDEVPQKHALSASSMVQAFPGSQDVVGVRRWRVRCGLPTNRPEPAILPSASLDKRIALISSVENVIIQVEMLSSPG